MGSDGLIESTKEEVKQRLKSPYAGSYVLAWCAVNYEFLIVVFSGGDYTEKIGYLARHLSFGQSPWTTFGLPALLAFIPVLVLPVLNQLASLWSKAVEVGGTHLSGRMETGKWVSDIALRELAFHRQLELNSLRGYAQNLYRARAALLGSQAQAYSPGKSGWVQLPGARELSSRLDPKFAQMVEGPGFPNGGYQMLKHLQDVGVRSEDQLCSVVTNFNGREELGELVAILFAAGLTDLKWSNGQKPSFAITSVGTGFLQYISERHPEAFTP